MTTSRKNDSPNIIMIDYYDGVIEGAILKFKDSNSYYFKLIAWDSFQDKRLFVLKSIDDSIFNQLNLNNIKNTSNKELIDSCRKELVNSELLIIGEKIDADSLSTFNMNEILKDKVSKVLDKEAADDLEDWIPFLNDPKEL